PILGLTGHFRLEDPGDRGVGALFRHRPGVRLPDADQELCVRIGGGPRPGDPVRRLRGPGTGREGERQNDDEDEVHCKTLVLTKRLLRSVMLTPLSTCVATTPP